MSKQTVIAIIIAVVVMGLGIGIWFLQKEAPKYTGPVKKVTIATGTGPVAGIIYVAFANGYFKDQGLDAVLLPTLSGKASLQAMLEGKADLANPAIIPTIHEVLRGKKLYILTTTLSTEGNHKVVARKDRGITQPSDLKGKKIAVTLGTNADFFLDVLLTVNGIMRGEVVLMNRKPSRMFDAIVGGEVDAISTWYPYVSKAQKGLGDKAVTFSAKGLTRSVFLLVTKQEYIQANPEIAKKLLRALDRASEFIVQSPEESQDIIAEYGKTDRALLHKLWDIYHFDMTLNQSLLVDMENRTSWVMDNNLADKTNIPNYLNSIYFDALMAVKPEAVIIIR